MSGQILIGRYGWLDSGQGTAPVPPADFRPVQNFSLPWHGSTLTMATASKQAGGWSSLVWSGAQMGDFGNWTGRGLQSAASQFRYDGSGVFPTTPEQYNPTQDGPLIDDNVANLTRSSLLYIAATPTYLKRARRSAYWLAPGQSSVGHPALNTQILSNWDSVEEWTFGFNGHDILRYDLSWTIPPAADFVPEPDTFLQFSRPVHHFPASLGVTQFEMWDPVLGPSPVVPTAFGVYPMLVSTGDGLHSLGMFWADNSPPPAPFLPTDRYTIFTTSGIYGVVGAYRANWLTDGPTTTPKTYSVTSFLCIGTRADVLADFAYLETLYPQQP